MWFRKASVVLAVLLMGCTATGTGTDPTEVTTATLMADATEITDADIPTPELEALIAAEVGDHLYAIPSSEGAIIYVRLRAEDTHRMYATSCDVLTSVQLPAGWTGTCLERTVEGQRITGEFSYSQASQ